VGDDSDPGELGKDELRARVEGLGINHSRLMLDTQKALKAARNEVQARKMDSRTRESVSHGLSIEEMKNALQLEGLPIAARTKEEVSDEDIKTIYELTHPEESE